MQNVKQEGNAMRKSRQELETETRKLGEALHVAETLLYDLVAGRAELAHDGPAHWLISRPAAAHGGNAATWTIESAGLVFGRIGTIDDLAGDAQRFAQRAHNYTPEDRRIVEAHARLATAAQARQDWHYACGLGQEASLPRKHVFCPASIA